MTWILLEIKNYRNLLIVQAREKDNFELILN